MLFRNVPIKHMFTFRLMLVKFVFTLWLVSQLASCDLKQIDTTVLKVANGADPQTIDLHKCTGMSGIRIISSLYEGLVSRADSSRVVPGVAKSWEVSEDGLTYTFYLREARWSDGSPLTAYDFEYSWMRLVNPKTAAQYSNLMSAVHNAVPVIDGKMPIDSLGIIAIDDTTFVVQLDYPQPYFINLCSFEPFFPVHKLSVEKHGKRWVKPENMISNGAYTLAELKYRQYIGVTKNHQYWDSKSVSVNTIHFYSIENNNTATAMFKSGEIDWTFTIPSWKIKRWKSEPEFNSLPQFGVYFYRLNHNNPALQNKKFRQALSYAIDRKTITEFITKGGQQYADSYIPPGLNWYTPKEHGLYNPEKAKQLMAESQLTPETIPELEILYNTSEAHKIIAEAISKMWEDVLGIKVTLRNYEWKVLLDALNKYEYSIARGSWIGDYIDPSTFTDIFTSTNGNNRTGFSNARYDSLAHASALTSDESVRAALFYQMEEILLDELPVIPIYFYRNIELRSPRLENITDNLLGLYNFKGITLKDQ